MAEFRLPDMWYNRPARSRFGGGLRRCGAGLRLCSERKVAERRGDAERTLRDAAMMCPSGSVPTRVCAYASVQLDADRRDATVNETTRVVGFEFDRVEVNVLFNYRSGLSASTVRKCFIGSVLRRDLIPVARRQAAASVQVFRWPGRSAGGAMCNTASPIRSGICDFLVRSPSLVQVHGHCPGGGPDRNMMADGPASDYD